jgi:hypothetical protein
MSRGTTTTRSPESWRSWPAKEKEKLLKRLRELAAARQAAAPSPALLELKADPSRILSRAGMTPDPWQAELLRRPCSPTLLLAARQGGKSLAAAALALREALFRPASLVLILSPTLRQSGEIFREKVLLLYDGLGATVAEVRRTALELRLANGSRVVSLPENEAGVRGYSGVRLLVIDEAARVDDALYLAVRPMLAVSHGSLIALSTPFGQRGWFYEAWDREPGWRKVAVPVSECQRITPDFLAEEEAKMGPRWFRQEYHLSFEAAVGSAFSPEAVDRALAAGPEPLFG